MQKIGIQEIPVNVEKPSRYLGTEVHRIIKDPAAMQLHMALAFPDLYDIGTSHFGIQILYHLLNQSADIFVERVFAPAKDMEASLRQNHTPLSSLETYTPLGQFHILGFSLLYELNFTNVLNMLDLAGLPLYADQRNETHPLVIAGGPCIANPEPMAPFFDTMVFGDGEEVLPRMAAIWMEWRKSEACNDRRALLQRWAQIQGVYVPAFFNAVYDSNGFQRLEPVFSGYTQVTRAIVADLENAFFPEQPTIPFGKPVHDRLRLEISRGCSRGCRFCQAGMIYRPVRERSPQRLLQIAANALAATGYEDLSLLSLSTGDYTCLAQLMEQLMQRCRSQRVAISLPSIRAGTLTPELMTQIKKVRKTGFTIAPEAGSQRLRDVINKNICFEEIAATIRDAFALGWQVIKLYFMIGLPTETQEDLDAIVEMVQALKRIKAAKRRGQINVSITTFIPKAHTPFQWAPQISVDDAWAKINYLKVKLRQPGIQLKWQHPHMSLLEGVVARGDRRLARVIEQAWRLGCTFDGWSDQFNFERWERAFVETGAPIALFTTRQRSLDEPLPWDHMDARLAPSFLKAQWQEAQIGATLHDCRNGQCYQCGVCDFETIEPQRFDYCPQTSAEPAQAEAPESFQQFELIYTKLNQARFFGHLEVAGIFARALRRAAIPVLYSQGFHPMPRLSFDDPIPLGMQSQGELMRLRVAPQATCAQVVNGLNAQLPLGLAITHCHVVESGASRYKSTTDAYQVVLELTAEDRQRLKDFIASEQWLFQRSNRKGQSSPIDLKVCVRHLEQIDAQTLHLVVQRSSTHTLRPADILRSILELSEERISSLRVIKLAPEVAW